MDLADTTLSEHKTDSTILCSCNYRNMSRKNKVHCTLFVFNRIYSNGPPGISTKATLLSQGSSLRQRLRIEEALASSWSEETKTSQAPDHERVIVISSWLTCVIIACCRRCLHTWTMWLSSAMYTWMDLWPHRDCKLTCTNDEEENCSSDCGVGFAAGYQSICSAYSIMQQKAQGASRRNCNMNQPTQEFDELIPDRRQPRVSKSSSESSDMRRGQFKESVYMSFGIKWSGENRRRRLVHYQPLDGFPLMAGSNLQPSDCDFNPAAISRWTRKCLGSVADSSCELPDFSRKKYSNTGRYPGNDNRYPLGHEHGYEAGIEGCRFAPPNFQLNISKDPPFNAHQQINRGHRNFWDDRPHFVGDFLCGRSCFNL